MVHSVPHAVGHGPFAEERSPAPAHVQQDRRRTHDVQVRVVLARERCRREILCRRARSDCVGALIAQPDEGSGNWPRQIAGNDDPFDGPTDLRAQRADRLPVVRAQARETVELIIDQGLFSDNPPEGIRRDAEAGRHADALDPEELPKVRSLATNDRDLAPVDLLQIQHVAAHGVHCQHVRAPCSKTPTLVYLGHGGVGRCRLKWGWWGSNPRPRDYESPALTTELQPLTWSFVLQISSNFCLALPVAPVCLHDRHDLGTFTWALRVASVQRGDRQAGNADLRRSTPRERREDRTRQETTRLAGFR